MGDVFGPQQGKEMPKPPVRAESTEAPPVPPREEPVVANVQGPPLPPRPPEVIGPPNEQVSQGPPPAPPPPPVAAGPGSKASPPPPLAPPPLPNAAQTQGVPGGLVKPDASQLLQGAAKLRPVQKEVKDEPLGGPLPSPLAGGLGDDFRSRILKRRKDIDGSTDDKQIENDDDDKQIENDDNEPPVAGVQAKAPQALKQPNSPAQPALNAGSGPPPPPPAAPIPNVVQHPAAPQNGPPPPPPPPPIGKGPSGAQNQQAAGGLPNADQLRAPVLRHVKDEEKNDKSAPGLNKMGKGIADVIEQKKHLIEEEEIDEETRKKIDEDWA